LHVQLCLYEDRSLSCLRHPFGSVPFPFAVCPNGRDSLTDSFT
jgi:hypothetical protein